MWNPDDIIVWRGIHRNRVWHAQPTFVVKDSPEEMVLALLPGAKGTAEPSYAKAKNNSKHWWDFKDEDWQLVNYIWQTNRLLFILEPEKYYSIIYFWNHANNEFLCYYINFQLPFQRSHCGIDTLDLELDLIINPDFSYEWKDVEDYERAIDREMIFPEWMEGIDTAKQEILERLDKRQYPFDGSWLDWKPDPNWSPPTLPETWEII